MHGKGPLKTRHLTLQTPAASTLFDTFDLGDPVDPDDLSHVTSLL